jgi:ferrochelatase
MPKYQSTPEFEHGSSDVTGILLVNLGTPDAPTTAAVRHFLKLFLSDPRVVELPRLLWWLILNGVILRFRPSRSAKAYQEIWTDQGSPLLLYSRAIANGVRDHLEKVSPGSFRVELAMAYSDPFVSSAIDNLQAAGARRLLVLPLYPQYSGTTTASVFDLVTNKLQTLRWIPETRFINQYHDEPGYVAALVASVREHWEENGRGDHLMFSFHGVPLYTLEGGDPYHCQCQKTGRLVASALGLGDEEWTLSFQSRVGRDEWLRPYTDETVATLAGNGIKRLDVVCPGFSTDCLETLEEIAMQNAGFFKDAGGESLQYIPALNDRDDHIAFLSSLVDRHVSGWSNAPADPDTRARAEALGANQ